MTILIIAHNQKSQLQICMESIREFCDIDNVSVVVIDNYSDDGTKEWLAEEGDVAFAVTEEKEEVFKLVNQALELFQIEDDLLLLKPESIITPFCLSNMQEAIYQKDEIAIVEPIVMSSDSELQNEVILIKKAMLDEIGRFSEETEHWNDAIKDYKERAVQNGFSVALNLNALIYTAEETKGNSSAAVDSEPGKWLDYITYTPSFAKRETVEEVLTKISKYCVRLKADGKLLIKFPVAGLGEKPRYSYDDIYTMFYRRGFAIQSTEAKHFMSEADEVIGYEMCVSVKTEKHMLMLVPDNVLIQYNLKQIASAYEKLGWKIFYTEIKCFSSKEIYQVLQNGIDRVWVINNTGLIVTDESGKQNWWDKLGIPSFNYILDHPMYYDDTLCQAPELSTILCVDQNHVNYLKRFYPEIKRSCFLPLAGDGNLDGIATAWKDREIDVLYVGGYKGNLDVSLLPEGSGEILDELLKNRDWTTEYAIEQVLKKRGFSGDEEQLKEEILKYRKIDWYIMTYIRVEAVRALVRGGVRVTVYGSNWEQFEYFDSPNFIYKGRVSQEECLERMKDSKIVLNVMPWFKAGTHDRVINAMLAGAVCLTDGSSFMDELFEQGRDYISYDIKHLEQLPGIVQDILQGDNSQMITTAYQKAVEQHRWVHRIAELEKEFER